MSLNLFQIISFVKLFVKSSWQMSVCRMCICMCTFCIERRRGVAVPSSIIYVMIVK